MAKPTPTTAAIRVFLLMTLALGFRGIVFLPLVNLVEHTLVLLDVNFEDDSTTV